MLGLKPKIVVKNSFTFSESEKRMIVEDYLTSGLNKNKIWEKHTGCKREHGRILEWMRRYGYISENKEIITTFASKIELMSLEDTKQEASEFDISDLLRRNSDLEKQLRESEFKSLAWQTMIEIAEKEHNIDIKKKIDTKPLKR